MYNRASLGALEKIVDISHPFSAEEGPLASRVPTRGRNQMGSGYPKVCLFVLEGPSPVTTRVILVHVPWGPLQRGSVEGYFPCANPGAPCPLPLPVLFDPLSNDCNNEVETHLRHPVQGSPKPGSDAGRWRVAEFPVGAPFPFSWGPRFLAFRPPEGILPSGAEDPRCQQISCMRSLTQVANAPASFPLHDPSLKLAQQMPDV